MLPKGGGEAVTSDVAGWLAGSRRNYVRAKLHGAINPRALIATSLRNRKLRAIDGNRASPKRGRGYVIAATRYFSIPVISEESVSLSLSLFLLFAHSFPRSLFLFIMHLSIYLFPRARARRRPSAISFSIIPRDGKSQRHYRYRKPGA